MATSTIQKEVYIHLYRRQSHLNQKAIIVQPQVVMMKPTAISRTITNKSSEDLDFGQQYPNCLQEESNQSIWIPCLPNLKSKSFAILTFDVHPLLERKETRKMRRYYTTLHRVQIRGADDCMRAEGTRLYPKQCTMKVYSSTSY